MVKVELEYNPYLQETIISFNGKKPRINSLVEKFYDSILQNWSSQIPYIFRDEMNGYDFDLEFQGTELDFDEIKKSFQDKGISQEEVRLVHKKVLENRNKKIEEVYGLLDWIKNNPNHNFDYEKFRKENEELFDGSFPFVIINGKNFNIGNFKLSNVGFEFVNKMSELDSVDLDNTPVLVCIDSSSLKKISDIINYLYKRTDINSKLIFYYIQNSLDKSKVERIIKDLHVKDAQIINSINDELVKKNFEVYPMTLDIKESIVLFRENGKRIVEDLAEKNLKSEKNNKVVKEKIQDYDAQLEMLKNARKEFVEEPQIEIPYSWRERKFDYLAGIEEWKSKKVKITNETEARCYATDLNVKLREDFEKLKMDFDGMVTEMVNHEMNEYRHLYEVVGFDADYYVYEELRNVFNYYIPPITYELMLLHEENYVEAKEALKDRFFKQQSSQIKMVLEKSYYYHEWREFAIKTATPVIEKMMDDTITNVNLHLGKIRQQYINHLDKMIDDFTYLRENESKLLSDEERILQADNDWINEFNEKLREIERG